MTSAFHPNGAIPDNRMRKMSRDASQNLQATQGGALLRNARRSAPAQVGSCAASRRFAPDGLVMLISVSKKERANG